MQRKEILWSEGKLYVMPRLFAYGWGVALAHDSTAYLALACVRNLV